jgi:hypothetical protein
MHVEVAVVSLSNDLRVIGCPLHGMSNRISYSSAVNQIEVGYILVPTDTPRTLFIVLDMSHKKVRIVIRFYVNGISCTNEGNLLPVWNNTALKTSFEESIIGAIRLYHLVDQETVHIIAILYYHLFTL